MSQRIIIMTQLPPSQVRCLIEVIALSMRSSESASSLADYLPLAIASGILERQCSIFPVLCMMRLSDTSQRHDKELLQTPLSSLFQIYSSSLLSWRSLVRLPIT